MAIYLNILKRFYPSTNKDSESQKIVAEADVLFNNRKFEEAYQLLSYVKANNLVSTLLHTYIF